MAGEHLTTLVISEEQRADWEEYIGDQPEFNGKAGLIRRAVEKEIHSEAEQDTVANHVGAVPAVHNEVRQLHSVITDLHTAGCNSMKSVATPMWRRSSNSYSRQYQTTVEAIEARAREPSEKVRDRTNDILCAV